MLYTHIQYSTVCVCTVYRILCIVVSYSSYCFYSPTPESPRASHVSCMCVCVCNDAHRHTVHTHLVQPSLAFRPLPPVCVRERVCVHDTSNHHAANCTTLHHNILHYTKLHHTTPQYTILHYITLHCTTQPTSLHCHHYS
jgi:hypothetical protein